MKDEKKKEEFPGYPHYPASDDITHAGNNTGEESLEEETDEPGSTPDVAGDIDNDADITAEDLKILGAIENGSTEDDNNLLEGELDDTDEDGDPLNESSTLSLSGSDLDVPGSEDDDADEAMGEEDEENNYYSLGGDNHEGQEENNGDQ
ncbi:MAG: hypothetical protein P4L41_12910 [Flavipsychrobacter sp.]|nr:hypothetical protein [Flavipsychrobacter sp.]